MKLQVEGMTCGGCVKAVTNIIHELDDAAEVTVDLATGVVQTTAKADADAVCEALEDGGFPARVSDS